MDVSRRHHYSLVRTLALLAAFAMTFALLPSLSASAAAHTTFISEFHYDNAGTDQGEFIEITAPAGTDLEDWQVVLYNAGSDPDAAVVYNTTTFDPGTVVTDEVAGYGTVVIDYSTNGLQNGDDDGFALVDPSGSVVELLSYEGVFTAGDGPAEGMTSTDVGVTQGSSTPIGASIERVGDIPGSFDWVSDDDNSKGAPNPGSTIDGVEIPAEDAPPPPPPAACDVAEDDLTLISEIQGPGDATPIADEHVTVEAVVTLVAPGLSGLFVQEEANDQDDDPDTSEGLFVFTGGNLLDGLEEADTVQVTGTVSEFEGKTQITSFDDVVLCDVEPVVIEPVELPLPSSPAERERFENMLVTASDLVVSGSFSAYRFGELITGYQDELPSATQVAPPGSEAAAAQEDIKAREVILDDRDSSGVFGRSVWDQDPERRLGDEIPEVTGVLDYSFGNYKLQYAEFPEIELFGAPEVPRLDAGNDVGAFNVLNFFNEFGDSDRLRGARSQEQFEIQSSKIVTTILELDATVLGLVELQNDYLDEFDGDPTTEPSIATLVDLLNAEAGEDRYDYVRVPEDQLATTGLNDGGVGTDAIANGIIYQPEKTDQVGTAATFDIDAELVGDSEKNRWPVAASFDIDGEVVTVVVNHFKSKGSSCDKVGGPGFDTGDDNGANSDQVGNCDLTRQYAADRLIEWVDTDPTGVDDEDIFLVGDFNAYAEEEPIQILEAAGYVDTVELLADEDFTYKFSGRVGTLDYIFASPSLIDQVGDAEVWQVNSRASYVDLYYIDPVDLTGPKGSSDHDPLVVSLLPAAPVDTGPNDKDECKDGGWMSFTDPSFRNQGQCVAAVASGELRGADKPVRGR